MMTQPQLYPGWCGPNSVRNAALVYGIHKTQEWVVDGEDMTEGWDAPDILAALARLGFRHDTIETSSKRRARAWLKKWGHLAPMLICVDHWEHWVTIIGGCGDRLILVDGDTSPGNQREQGCFLLKPGSILERWKASREVAGGDGKFYGIAVLKGTK